MWYFYISKHYLAINNNEIMEYDGKWMELKIRMLSEIGCTEKEKKVTCSISYVEFRPKRKKRINVMNVKKEDCLVLGTSGSQEGKKRIKRG
jgi:hypothetical protein